MNTHTFERMQTTLTTAPPSSAHMHAVLRTAAWDEGDDPDLDATINAMTDLQVAVAGLEVILALVACIATAQDVTMRDAIESTLSSPDFDLYLPE
jgi:hypothetical protein